MSKSDLAAFLDKSGLSASAFAAKIGVHRNTVAGWLKASGPQVPPMVGYVCAALWARLEPWQRGG